MYFFSFSLNFNLRLQYSFLKWTLSSVKEWEEDLWRAESELKKMNFRETDDEKLWTHFIYPHHWRLHQQRRNIIFLLLQLKDISCGWIWEQKCPLIVWLSICDVFQHHTPVDSSRKLCRSRAELQWINYQALSRGHSPFHVHICIEQCFNYT